MDYSYNISCSIDAIEVDDSMKSRVLDVENARFKIKQREARIRRKRQQKILLSFLIVCVSLFVATNTTTYAMTGKHLWNMFFSEKEKVTYEPLHNETDYGFVVDGYTFNIIEALYEKNTQSGCWVVAITKDGKAPEITLDNSKHMISKGFGENERFEIIPYYRNNIEYEIRDDVLYACLIYHGDIENCSTFELVDYEGPWKKAWDVAKPFQENKVSDNSEVSTVQTTGMAIGDYKVYNLGKTDVYMTESGGWNREDTGFVNGLGIYFNAEMTGGCFCLSGKDEFGTTAFVSPFGFMIYSDTEEFSAEKYLNMKNGNNEWIFVNYSSSDNIVGLDGIIVRSQFVCGGTYATRIDLDNVESITIGDRTIALSEIMNQDKGEMPVTDYSQYEDSAVTPEQLQQITQWINDKSHYGFLCSSYKDVVKADFDLIFMGGAGLTYIPVSKEELAEYTQDICDNVIKIPYDEVEDFLNKNTGRSPLDFENNRYVSYMDIINIGYYYIDNKSADHGKFECTSGTQKGDIITVNVKCDDYSSELMLRQVGNSYRVIRNVISEENISIVETQENRWGITGNIRTKEVNGVILERDELWIKDDNVFLHKNTQHGDTVRYWTFYKDNTPIYIDEVYTWQSSGGPIGEYDTEIVNPNADVKVKLEEADITGITDISITDVIFNYVGEETASVDYCWYTAWPYEKYSSKEDVYMSNLINIIGKKVGESVLFTKKMVDGRTIMTKCTILEIIS